MLTDNKEITTPEYWAKIYEGKNDNAKVDASNTKRPANSFDRFTWLADQVEGPKVLDIGSGHARTVKIMKAKHPDWQVFASDQTEAAMKAANYKPYQIFSAYEIPYPDKSITTVTASQCIEYMEFPDKFLKEAQRVAKYFVCTVPIGVMDKWSQLREYSDKSFLEWLYKFGTVTHFDSKPGIMLGKIRFYSTILK